MEMVGECLWQPQLSKTKWKPFSDFVLQSYSQTILIDTVEEKVVNEIFTEVLVSKNFHKESKYESKGAGFVERSQGTTSISLKCQFFEQKIYFR